MGEIWSDSILLMCLDSSVLCILQHCLDYTRARTFLSIFSFHLISISHLSVILHTCRERLFLGESPHGDLTGRGAATVSLESPSDILLLGHRYNLNPQDQDCGPDKWSMARHRSRQTPLFLATRLGLCLLIYVGRWFSEFPVLQ